MSNIKHPMYLTIFLLLVSLLISNCLNNSLPAEQKYISYTVGASLLLGVITIGTTYYNNYKIDIRNIIKEIESVRPRFSIVGEKIGCSERDSKIIISFDCPQKITLDMFSVELINTNSRFDDKTSEELNREFKQHDGVLMPNQSITFRPPTFKNPTSYEQESILEILQENNEMYLMIKCRTYYDEEIIYKLGHNFSDHYVKFNNKRYIESALNKNLKYSFYKKMLNNNKGCPFSALFSNIKPQKQPSNHCG
ncbi:hypothetical protein GJU84_11220 [Staphylococcus chromogenes]|uniref:hypothetical protein n=1 Tax=Staphylococcus chromogenes TaxID=46126 RepID=UPI0014049C64|nr:hypothetical protein [Staphylococcus chromogenes]QIN27582.1 hypothetical protein GJU84_11220 [Staphylococcus chromogenes]